MAEQHAQSLTNVLLHDAIAAIRRTSSDDQATRREAVRTLFASCEGLIWDFRNHVVSAATQVDALGPDEAAVLAEQQYFVSDNGKISSQTKFLSASSTIRLCANIAKRLDATFEADFTGHEWRGFLVFVRLRNRLAHPKSVEDLAVSDQDIAAAVSSFLWIADTIAGAMQAANNAVLAHRNAAARLIAELEAGDPDAWAQYRELLRAPDDA